MISIDPRFLRLGWALLLLTLITFVAKTPALFYFFLVLFLGHLFFFRDPSPKKVPEGQVLSPASGKIVEMTTVYEPRYLKQEAVKIGIFLSVFDVHVTRAPEEGEVGFLEYVPGKYLNALNPESVVQNESNWIGMKTRKGKILVRQISGAIARRIACDVCEKQAVTQGQKLGIICYGSRTEVYFPTGALEPWVKLGQRISAGRTVLGKWLI